MAMIGGFLAIILTPPFAIAYYSAYPGFDIPPFWIALLRPTLGPMLSFSSPITVYNVYGRVFNLVYLLMLPGVFGLHSLHQNTPGRAEKWGFYLQVVGLVATLIGVADDYWADGVTFILELSGLLILSIGATLYGVAILRSKIIPGWCGWLLVSCLPGVFVMMRLIWHIPSAPTFLYAVSWLFIGSMLFFKKGIRPQPEKQGLS